MKHTLIIKSLHDAQAKCSCGWSLTYTGKMSYEQVKEEYNRHLPKGIAHTPGPWEEDNCIIIEGRSCPKIYANKGYHIGTWIDSEWEGFSPNSRLIAVGPDLLEVCREMVGHLKEHPLGKGMAETYEKMKQIISKAEGREEE